MTVRVLVGSVVGLAVWLALRLAGAAGEAARRRWQRRRRGRCTRGLVDRWVAVLLGLGVATATPSFAPASFAGTSPAAEGDLAGPPGDDTAQAATMRPIAPTRPDPSPPAPAELVWTIEPGDHLWGLSRAALAQAFARPPTDTEVAAYVADVVDRNRHVLVVRDDPDLVLPGQVFVRPPLPPLPGP